MVTRAGLGSSFSLLVRISTTSWLPESNLELRRDVILDDRGKLTHGLSRLGVNFIDVSVNELVPRAQIPVAPGYQVPYIQEVQSRDPLPASAVGLITELAQAEQILVTRTVSVVGVGKPLLTDPPPPLAWATRLGSEPPVPEPYTQDTPRA